MRHLWLGGVAVLVCQASAVAQQNDSTRTSRDSTRNQRVFMLGAIEVLADRARTPGTMSADVAAIRAHERRDLGGALELLPGVSTSGFGARNEAMVTVRGFDLRQVPVFMDGIPVYVPYDGYVDLRRFTTYDAAEVRLSRGFSSVLYGPNAMGGAINVLSRRPTERLELEAGAGAFTGSGREAYANVGSAFGAGYVQASVSRLDQNRFRLPDDDSVDFRDNSDRRDFRGSLKLGWLPSERSEIALAVSAQEGRKGVPPYAGSDPLQVRRYWRWPEWNKSGASVFMRTALGSNVAIHGRGYYDTFDNTLLSFDDDTYSAQTRRSSFTSIYDDYTIGGSVGADLEAGSAHRPRLAFHFKDDTHREHNVGEPVRRFRDRTLSAGFEHTWQPQATMSIALGLSVERRETLTADDFVNGQITPFAKGDGTSFNPQVAWFTDVARGTLRASVSRKTRFPTIKDRYSYRMGTALPNPDLGSESATHFEIGYARAIRNLTFDIAIFDAEIDDLIQQVDSVSQDVGGAYLWQFQNVGRARRTGLDVSVSARLTDRLTAGGNYSYLDHENISNPNVRLTGVPSHHGLAYVRANPVRWLDLMASVDAYSKRFGSSSGFELAGFNSADIRVALRPREGLELALGARNILDERYELTPGFPEPGRNLFINATWAPQFLTR